MSKNNKSRRTEKKKLRAKRSKQKNARRKIREKKDGSPVISRFVVTV